MYIPKYFENNNINDLLDFIERYNFSTLIAVNNGAVEISHVPVMLDRKKGKLGVLCWHLAKQNKQSLLFNENNQVTFIFQGPHSYISPSWYKTYPNVPTWNYSVVHVYGVPKKITKEELSNDLDKFVSHHESMLEINKKYIIPEDHKTKLLEYIDGFHLEITHIEGKFKLGQNHNSEDQVSVLNELLNQHANYSALSLAEFIEHILPNMEQK